MAFQTKETGHARPTRKDKTNKTDEIRIDKDITEKTDTTDMTNKIVRTDSPDKIDKTVKIVKQRQTSRNG